jgi:ABC-type dipeptide/oligopeptide/nickel transport system permease component
MDCSLHPGVEAPHQCSRCGEFVCPACRVTVDRRPLCRTCLERVREQLGSRYLLETRHVNYPLGLLAGLVAAAGMAYLSAESAVWLGYRLPVWGAALGGLVGLAVKIGAGGKRGERLQEVAAVLALVGVAVGWFLTALLTAAAVAYGMGGSGVPLTDALHVFPTYLRSDLGLLDWVFLLLGVGWAWWLPHPRLVPD